jgi:inhibitor of KinA
MNVSNLNIYPLGDQALTLQLSDQIDASVNQQVMHIFHHLQNHPIKAVTDIIPAYSSITIVYDLAQIGLQHRFSSSFEWIKATIIQHIESINASNLIGRHIKIPACYDVSLGLDLIELAQHNQLSVEEVIHKHTSQTYQVYMIGFLPGFPYMAAVDPSIQMNRRAVPRQIVPKGSVGIAGAQTGIYPLDSPGGWQIIGQIPLNLFDISKENPCLLSPGDRVEFYTVSLEEFWEIRKAITA